METDSWNGKQYARMKHVICRKGGCMNYVTRIWAYQMWLLDENLLWYDVLVWLLTHERVFTPCCFVEIMPIDFNQHKCVVYLTCSAHGFLLKCMKPYVASSYYPMTKLWVWNDSIWSNYKFLTSYRVILE